MRADSAAATASGGGGTSWFGCGEGCANLASADASGAAGGGVGCLGPLGNKLPCIGTGGAGALSAT